MGIAQLPIQQMVIGNTALSAKTRPSFSNIHLSVWLILTLFVLAYQNYPKKYKIDTKHFLVLRTEEYFVSLIEIF